jgi:hypothetical protein
MAGYRWLIRAQIIAALGIILALAACSTGGPAAQGGSTPANTPSYTPPITDTPTPTVPAPTPTPTLTPPMCNANYNPGYVSTLPSATFKATSVYAQVQLPPLTREYDNDAAGGMRFRQMCSGGTTNSVLNFMNDHLMQLGWQKTDISTKGCLTVGSFYAQQQCWQNGSYELVMGINENTDWVISFYDPDFHA